ncbi:aminopeptidase N [Nocardioides panaciterrulae]|uniref:Aminopeptidase N n=1 Tax=Nocardioides panaciterrulae TaxID=661492 RepID=A0A7Y9JAP5_9ACTN|nr:aminopeptidase N [Nocardioides panaciterrulae]
MTAANQSPSTSLKRAEAEARFELLDVASYDVHLDLASDEATFRSVTTLRFTSRGGATFVDLKPLRVNEIRLNGSPLDADLLERGRLPLATVEGANELVVDAVMRFRNDGEGLHRSVDPADGRHYVYGMSFMDAAPSIFACFDQPDLKAPYTFHVTAPSDWVVVGNAPSADPEPGAGNTALWEFEQTQPLSTYFVTLVAGPYHVIRDHHDGIALGLSARQSIAKDLDADADELFTMTRQCFDEYHRLFGIRYPFGDYHQAFVPEFNAGAMENPGCVTFRDPLVFSSRVTRGVRIQRASTVAHEMAHQWFGNLTTPKWWDDLWLNESFAEYMGNRVTGDVTEYGDVWTHNSYARRQWGLVADQRPSTHPVAGNGAADASSALQDFDGISYAKGSSILKQLNARLGDEVFFAGVVDHFTTHRFGNATMHDLFASWERAAAQRASAVDLSTFTSNWLRTAGPDAITLDRAAGVVRRTPPADHPADRSHTLRVATARPQGGEWEVDTLSLAAAETPVAVVGGDAVVLDPFEDTWAVAQPDPTTVAALTALLPTTADPALRAGIWNNVRSGFHNAAVAPAAVVELLVAGLPSEDTDDAIFYTLPWTLREVVPMTTDPAAAMDRLHAVLVEKATGAAAGSTLQLAAFQSAVSTATDAGQLRSWLAGRVLPEGLEVDLDLRWRMLVQLATLGETDREELQRALEAEPTARSRVEHSRAMASLPDAEAKAWAWARFTGEVDVPNYELEAAGLGMWRAGQEHLTAPYVERYFAEVPATVEVRSGWNLADGADSFFPVTAVDEQTVALARALLADAEVDASIRRRVVDATDDLEHRLAVRRAFPTV